MIYLDSGVFKAFSMKASFKDEDTQINQYTNDRKYYEELVGKWGHLSDLSFTKVTLTPEQQARLDLLNGSEAVNQGNFEGTFALFVEHGVVVPEEVKGCFLEGKGEEYKNTTLDYYRELKRQKFKAIRDAGTSAPINGVQVGRETDRETILGAVRNFDSLTLVDGKKPWIMADNSVQLLTKEQLAELDVLYSIRKDACFVKYTDAVNALQAAQSIEEVMAVQMPE